MKKPIAKLLALFSIVLSVHASAAESININVDSENPPFMYAAGNKAAGLYPDLIAAILQTSGQPAQINAKPWARCIAEIDEAIAGVGGIYKNAKRLKSYDFSEPIFVEKMALYFNKTKPLNFTGVADLIGKKVGVIRGWSYGDEFDLAVKDGKISVHEVKSDNQNFQKLVAGRVDAILAIEEAGAAQLKDAQFAGIGKSAKYLFENPTFLAFNKNARQTELLAKFNKAIMTMKESGKLDKISSDALSK